MKPLVIALAALALALPCAAQNTTKFTAAKNNEYGLVYDLPTTRLRFTVVARKTVKKAGPYYKYAKKYLGTADAIMADSQTWDLVSITASAYGVPDDKQQYTMHFKSGTGSMPFIMKSADGLLLSINVENVLAPETTPKVEQQKETVLDNNNYASALSGDLLMSESVAKRAEMAAQQIYKLRESRTNYATGDADQMPPDGKALELIMQQLNEQEAALTAMFLGTTATSTAVRTFDYTPGVDNVKGEVLLRISDYGGIVDKNDLSGEPVYLSMQVLERGKMPVNEKGEEKKIPKEAVIYKIPGKAKFALTYEGNKVLTQDFDLAQLGIDFGLDPDLFSSKKSPAYVKFSPATGAVTELGAAEQ